MKDQFSAFETKPNQTIALNHSNKISNVIYSSSEKTLFFQLSLFYKNIQ